MAQVEIAVTIAGVRPLLMNQVARALDHKDPLTMRIKKLNAKRTNKTDDDITEIADLEFQRAAYTNEAGDVYMPGECLDAVLVEGAKQSKQGPKAKSGVLCDDGELVIDHSLNIDDLAANPEFRDKRVVVVQRARVLRTRPKFKSWKVRFVVTVESTIVDPETVKQWLEDAGRLKGLGDFRPRFGRFVVEKFEAKTLKGAA